MTRHQIRSALDRVLGGGTPERILRDLHSSIMRRRADGSSVPPAASAFRHLVEAVTNGGVTTSVLRQVRLAASKSASRTR